MLNLKYDINHYMVKTLLNITVVVTLIKHVIQILNIISYNYTTIFMWLLKKNILFLFYTKRKNF